MLLKIALSFFLYPVGDCEKNNRDPCMTEIMIYDFTCDFTTK